MQINQLKLRGFESSIQGEDQQTWRLQNSHGLELILTNYGPRVLSLQFPDFLGELKQLILGYEKLTDYQIDDSYQGQVAVGPYANRISNGFYLQPDDTHPHVAQNEKVYLENNDGFNTLHSATDNWANLIWRVKSTYQSNEKVGICLELNKKDFPRGKMFLAPNQIQVRMELSHKNEFKIKYHIWVDETMPINPTFHGYFNLNGSDMNSGIENHLVKSNSKEFIPVDDTLIPVGKIESVRDSRLDFTKKNQLKYLMGQNGFDHCFLFNQNEKGFFNIWSPITKIHMGFESTLPAYQFYTGNFLQDPFLRYQGFCLEAQMPIDGINHPEWNHVYGDSFLRPGDLYSHETIYHFKIKDSFV